MKVDKQKVFLKYVSFLIYPWISLLYAIKSLNEKSTHYVILMFGVLFGLAFVPKLDSGMDSIYYYQYFLEFSDLTVSDFTKDIFNYLSTNNNTLKDVYIHSVTFIVSIFTTNYHFFFGFLALVFGLFFIKSFRYLTLNDLFINNNLVCILLACMFSFSNPIFNINGVRFWTAAWISIFIVFKVILEKRKLYLFFLVLVPLIHSSYWVFVLLFIAYSLLRNKAILQKIFIVSFFLSGFMLAFIKDLSSYLPVGISHYIAVYTSESYMEYRQEQVVNLHWYIKVLDFLQIMYPNVIVLILAKVKSSNKDVNNLFRFIMLLMIFVNLTISIPSVGNRFILLSYPLIAVYWLYNMSYLNKYKLLIYLYPLVFIKDLFVLFQNFKFVTDPYFYFSPTFYFIYHII